MATQGPGGRWRPVLVGVTVLLLVVGLGLGVRQLLTGSVSAADSIATASASPTTSSSPDVPIPRIGITSAGAPTSAPVIDGRTVRAPSSAMRIDQPQAGPSPAVPSGHNQAAVRTTPALPATTTVPPVSTPDTTPTTTTATTTTEVSVDAEVVQWIASVGPFSGGATGTPEVALEAFSKGDCDGLTEAITESHDPYTALYTGAQAACRIVGGATSQWVELEDAVSKSATASSAFDCFARPLYDTMVELVTLHAQHPTAQITRSSAAPKPNRCPRIASVTPSHGSRTTSREVSFVGQNLPEQALIHINDAVVTVTIQDKSGTVTVPGSTDPTVHGVSIWPEGWPLESANTAFYQYDD